MMTGMLAGMAPAAPPTIATVLIARVTGVRAQRAEPAQALVAELRPAVERFGGSVAGLTGAGLVSTFDSAVRAVRAAAELRAALASVGVELGIGVHTGEVRRLGDDLSGPGVEVASALARFARPGAILVSRTVTELADGRGLAFAAHRQAPDDLPQPPFEALL
jgi:class 3 adenylate cyclase